MAPQGPPISFLTKMIEQVDEKHDGAHARLRNDLHEVETDVKQAQTDVANLRSEIATTVRTVVRDELAYSRSFKKNGSGLKDWLLRIFTPERLIYLVIAIYVVGGRVNQAQADIARAVAQSAQAVEEVKGTTSRLETDRKTMNNTLDDLRASAQTQLTKEEFATFAAQVAQLQDQVKANITRGEFQRVLEQQIIPRLTRIEKQVAQP